MVLPYVLRSHDYIAAEDDLERRNGASVDTAGNIIDRVMLNRLPGKVLPES